MQKSKCVIYFEIEEANYSSRGHNQHFSLHDVANSLASQIRHELKNLEYHKVKAWIDIHVYVHRPPRVYIVSQTKDFFSKRKRTPCTATTTAIRKAQILHR